jgi:hypothetical protein
MNDDHISRISIQKPPKGILKGEDTMKERDERRSIGGDLHGVVLDMKGMLDSDLAQKA